MYFGHGNSDTCSTCIPHKGNGVEDLCERRPKAECIALSLGFMEAKDKESICKFTTAKEELPLPDTEKDRFLANHYKLASCCSASRVRLVLLRRRRIILRN